MDNSEYLPRKDNHLNTDGQLRECAPVHNDGTDSKFGWYINIFSLTLTSKNLKDEGVWKLACGIRTGEKLCYRCLHQRMFKSMHIFAN